jgi:dihydrofolate reductase
MGGGKLVRGFLKADRVDELCLGIVPVLLGDGIPLFPSGFPQRAFALAECRSFSKGMVLLRYRRVRPKDKEKR